jgi:hypothetical protein
MTRRFTQKQYSTSPTTPHARPLSTLALLLGLLPWTAFAAPGDPIPLDCDPDLLAPPFDQQCRLARLEEGRRLFEEETFGGNGRTCLTCHSKKTGTFSQRDVAKRLSKDPFDPLFVHDGLDDGLFGTSRIEELATIRITLPLPVHLSLADDPLATEVVLNRGTPTTRNTPALDAALMHDLRDPNLQSQALGAIHGHAQNTVEPSALELELIAEFQRTDPQFFSDGRLRQFARTGLPPELPAGTTESEQRGRLFFVDAPFQPPSTDGVCALCHSGPMLNQTNQFARFVLRAPPGSRPLSAGVSERNKLGNPEYTFEINDGFGPPVYVTTPDIGILMTDLDTLVGQGWIPPLFVLPSLGVRLDYFANKFKTPTLWGVSKTAPYYHDNSARDLDEMLEQYDWFFENDEHFLGSIKLTEQDKEDIKAFLKLL